MKTAVSAGLAIFCAACGWVILDAVRSNESQKTAEIVPLAAVARDNSLDTAETGSKEGQSGVKEGSIEGQSQAETSVKFPVLNAANSPARTVTLGSLYDEIKRTSDPDKYKFQIQLTSKGAAVEKVVLGEFAARKEPPAIGKKTDEQTELPLMLLAPLGDERKVYSLANASLKVAPVDAKGFGTKSFPLDRLNWRLVETDEKEVAQFEAVLFEEGQDPAVDEGTLKIVKTYRVQPGSYEMLTDFEVKNLSSQAMKVLMEIQGPTGVQREDVRQDGRKVMASYKNTEITSRLLLFRDVQATQREITTPSQGLWAIIRQLFSKKQTPQQKLRLLPEQEGAPLIWAAMTNKYFAAIMRPVTDDPKDSVIRLDSARYYGSTEKEKLKDSVGEVSFLLNTDAERPMTLQPAGTDGAVQQFTLGTYLGPKDKEVFEDNAVYRALGYFHTIDFSSCCCPAAMIAPLAFGIIWVMKSMYTLMGPWGNYGVVIMVLVLVVRLILHPVTKKSQVSMMKMQKLGPRMQEIQKKYANNRAEMNKQVMQLYKENGATPVMGMLPMFLQMPIWIALWTAVYTSIDLRGAGFLPFWITDLSQPDHLFAIPFAQTLQTIPYLGFVVPSHLNLLPLLMGFVMYLQQKLMPAPQAAATNPQMAQQQKMMMILMPLMFPVMLYNGPSGVNLYIMASIGGGVIEQKVIRKHIQERQEEEEKGMVPTTSKLGGKLKKKKPKPFFRMK